MARVFRRALPFLLLGIVVVWLQLTSGAYRAEFSGADEPAHYITGLMIHDYIASKMPLAPMPFATNYYLHYPKVAFGIWPPLFHSVEAVWMLLFSASRASILSLMAVLTSLLAATLYLVARRVWPWWVALGLATLFVLLPTTQLLASRVFADMQVALLGFWATLCWSRYLERGGWRWAAAFGVLGGACLLTKGNGLALFAVPVLSLVLCRRFDEFGRRGFWIAMLSLAAIGGPWQIYSWTILRGTIGVPEPMWKRAVEYVQMLWFEVGPGIALCAVAGGSLIAARVLRKQPLQALHASMAALVAAVIACHILAPLAPTSRYLVAAMPPLLLLAADGGAWLADRVPVRNASPGARRLALALGAVGAFMLTSFLVPVKDHYGFTEAAHALLSGASTQDRVILVSSESNGDGMLIAELAMAERRPGHIILRADKVLSRSNWDGDHYELFYEDAAEVQTFLVSVPVDAVVVDSIPGDFRFPHHKLLEDTLAAHTDYWKPLGSYAGPPAGGEIRVFEAPRHPWDSARHVSIDMTYSLGRGIGTP